MPGIDPSAMADMILKALEITGKRGLLAGGGGIGRVDATSRASFLTSAPHDRLLPRASAAIHQRGNRNDRRVPSCRAAHADRPFLRRPALLGQAGSDAWRWSRPTRLEDDQRCRAGKCAENDGRGYHAGSRGGAEHGLSKGTGCRGRN